MDKFINPLQLKKMKKKYYLLTVYLVSLISFSQDTCLTSVLINSANSFTTPVITAVETINGTQTNVVCASNGVGQTASEWYNFTPTITATYTISTDIAINTPRIDTRFHIYSGTCATTLVCVGGDDDSGTNLSSFDEVILTAGITYTIAFDNRWSSTNFSFQISKNANSGGIPIVTTPVTFTSIPQAVTGTGICVVDMNGDFRDDIVGISNNNIQIKEQNTDGSFTIKNATLNTNITNMPTWSMAAGDINKDGFNDLVFGGGNGVSFAFSTSTPTSFNHFTTTNYVFSQRTNMVDLNKDGHLDVFVCHDVAPNVFYTNNGTGNLTFTQGGMGNHPNGGNYGSIFVDYDNDGDSDLFIAKCRGGSSNGANINEMHRNNGNGIFTDVSTTLELNDPIQTWSSAWADFDNDGDMDVLVGASSTANGNHKLMKNNLVTTNSVEEPFQNITALSGWDTNTSTSIEHTAHDFDNDGFVDVLGGGNKIMYNNRNLTFSSAPAPFNQGAVGDLNNDGFLDVFINGNIYKNNGNTNNWIKINLQGIQSNSNGIGARVEIYGAFGKQIRDVRSGDGFKFMSSLTTHFGIGTNTAITQIKIIWPSGLVDVISNPSINQSRTIIEGSALKTAEFFANSIQIYPNPTKDFITIQAPNTIKKVEIFDSKGLQFNVEINNNTIPVSQLQSGVYIIKIYTEDDIRVDKKFIKLN